MQPQGDKVGWTGLGGYRVKDGHAFCAAGMVLVPRGRDQVELLPACATEAPVRAGSLVCDLRRRSNDRYTALSASRI